MILYHRWKIFIINQKFYIKLEQINVNYMASKSKIPHKTGANEYLSS